MVFSRLHKFFGGADHDRMDGSLSSCPARGRTRSRSFGMTPDLHVRTDSLLPAQHSSPNILAERVVPRLSKLSKTFDAQMTVESLSQLLIWYLYWDIAEVAGKNCKWYQELPQDTMCSWIRLGYELGAFSAKVPSSSVAGLPAGLQKACQRLQIDEEGVCRRLIRLSYRYDMIKSEITEIFRLGDDEENIIRLREKLTTDKELVRALRPIANTSFEQKRAQILKRIDEIMALIVLPKTDPERHRIAPASNVPVAKQRDQVRLLLGKQGAFREAHPPQNIYDRATHDLRPEERLPSFAGPPMPPILHDELPRTTPEFVAGKIRPQVQESSWEECIFPGQKSAPPDLDENSPWVQAMMTQLSTLTAEVKQLSTRVAPLATNTTHPATDRNQLKLGAEAIQGFRTENCKSHGIVDNIHQDQVPLSTAVLNTRSCNGNSLPGAPSPLKARHSEVRNEEFRHNLHHSSDHNLLQLSRPASNLKEPQSCFPKNSSLTTGMYAGSSAITPIADTTRTFAPTGEKFDFNFGDLSISRAQRLPQVKSRASKKNPRKLNNEPKLEGKDTSVQVSSCPFSRSLAEVGAIPQVFDATRIVIPTAQTELPPVINTRGSSLQRKRQSRKPMITQDQHATHIPSRWPQRMKEQNISISNTISPTANSVLAMADWYSENRMRLHAGEQVDDATSSVYSPRPAKTFFEKHAEQCSGAPILPASSPLTSSSTRKARSGGDPGPSYTGLPPSQIERRKLSSRVTNSYTQSYVELAHGNPYGHQDAPHDRLTPQQRWGELSPGYVTVYPGQQSSPLPDVQQSNLDKQIQEMQQQIGMQQTADNQQQSYMCRSPSDMRQPRIPISYDQNGSPVYCQDYVPFSPTATGLDSYSQFASGNPEVQNISRHTSMRSASVYEPSIYVTPPTSPIVYSRPRNEYPPGAWRESDETLDEGRNIGRKNKRDEARKRF
jgi:hypothetical protein